MESVSSRRCRDPFITLDEIPDRIRVSAVSRDLAAPAYSSRGIRSEPCIFELTVIQGLERKVAAPRHPTIRCDENLQGTMNENSPRKLFPWPTEEVLVGLGLAIIQSHVGVSAVDHAVLEDEPRGLGGVYSSMSCHGIAFALLGFELARGDENEAVLEEYS